MAGGGRLTSYEYNSANDRIFTMISTGAGFLRSTIFDTSEILREVQPVDMEYVHILLVGFIGP